MSKIHNRPIPIAGLIRDLSRYFSIVAGTPELDVAADHLGLHTFIEEVLDTEVPFYGISDELEDPRPVFEDLRPILEQSGIELEDFLIKFSDFQHQLKMDIIHAFNEKHHENIDEFGLSVRTWISKTTALFQTNASNYDTGARAPDFTCRAMGGHYKHWPLRRDALGEPLPERSDSALWRRQDHREDASVTRPILGV